MDLFAAVDHLWEDTATHQSQPTLRRWAGPEPVMRSFTDLDDLVEVAQEAVTDPRRDAALAALSRLARTDQSAQLTDLRIMRPGLIRLDRVYGHDLDIDDVATRPNITVGPDLLTVEEAALILRISRTTAYKEVRRYRATDGREGIPVILVGGLLRVPRVRLEKMIGGPVHLPPPKPRPQDPRRGRGPPDRLPSKASKRRTRNPVTDERSSSRSTSADDGDA